MTRETTKHALTAGIILCAAAIIAGYAYFASYGLLDGPSIIPNNPRYSSEMTPTVTVSGVAKRVNTLTLDGRPIVIDPQGNFSEVLLLSPGYNIETLEGQDKFGRVTDVQLAFTYTYEK